MLTDTARKRGLRRLLLLTVPEWRRLAPGVALVAVGGAAGLCYPQALRLLVDGASGAFDATPLGIPRQHLSAAILAAMLALAILQGASAAVRYALFDTAGERIVSALRLRVYGAMLNQEMGFFDERPTGELLSRLTSDAESIKAAVSHSVSTLLSQTVGVLGGFAVLTYTSPPLTLAMFAVVPPVALGAVIIGRRVEALSRNAQDALAGAAAVAEEGIAGIRTVRAFDAESREHARYGASIHRALRSTMCRVRASAWLLFGVVFSVYASVGVVFWYGSALIQRGEITLGGLTSFLVYTLFVALSIASLASVLGELNQARGAAERVFELEDRIPAIATRGGLAPAPVEVQGRVSFAGVSFSYPTRPEALVLDDFHLEIAPGQAVALVGASGAGKTTVSSLLARFYDPAQGSIRLDGRDLRDLEVGWLRRQLGVVSQEPMLFLGTIADNIRYARPGASSAEVEAAARAANAHEFVRQLPDGYDTQVGERGARLSGGQKQRVAIARAILKDPRVLILDEATSALDAESEHLVKEALGRLMQGRTSIIVAHRLSTVAHAHRVVVMDSGRVVQVGSHEALMKQGGLYRRLVERQFMAA